MDRHSGAKCVPKPAPGERGVRSRNSEAAIAPSLRQTLNFQSGYKSCRCRIKGTLKVGFFTDYTGHNKIKTLPICRLDLLVGNTSVPTLWPEIQDSPFIKKEIFGIMPVTDLNCR